MEPTSFFVGLVSYEESSFSKSQGPCGLTAGLVEAFAELGVNCSSWINTGNLFDENSYELTSRMSRFSVREEVRLESEWFSFIQGTDRLGHRVRILARYASSLFHWRRNSESKELRRLLNIEYSHIDLYRRAVASGAEWAIILEDDAFSPDITDLVTGILSLSGRESGVKMINLSSSFSLDQIGIRHLLSSNSRQGWQGSDARSALGSARPATNTVCAIAFRTDFLKQILADFDSQPTDPSGPTVPIDWKLNAALMRLWDAEAIGSNECLFVDPAPIIQLSMVRDREGK
jgi:hypothetical protein